MGNKFNPFDKVIVRIRIDAPLNWTCTFYSHLDKDGCHVTIGGQIFDDKDILPYEGNEELAGKISDEATIEKTWSEQLQDLFKQAYEIADTWSNPLMNDAGGSMCCEYIKQDMDKWIKYFESWASQK